LLSDYDADIVLGCESHTDHSFLSSEILLATYKIICKDRCLGGGGVFIGYKDHLNICKESSLILDAEMIWVNYIIQRDVAKLLLILHIALRLITH